MPTNNDYLNDIAGSKRNSGKTNNQLLEKISLSGGTGGGLTPEQVTKLNSIDTKADLVDGKVPQSQLPTATAGLELGETSTKAHRGDHGKTAYDHTSRQDNPHNTTRYQVGLGSQYGYAELDASGMVKLDQINVSSLSFKGAWNASTNTPELLDGTGSVGDFYKVSVAGSQNFGNGLYVFNPGDWVIFAAGVWQRIGVHENVTSVNGKIGEVTISKEELGLSMVDNTSDLNKPLSTATQTAISSKQNTLVSGTSIKTINNQSILGSGNIDFNGFISSSVVNNVTVTEFGNRTEYQCKIPFTATIPSGAARFTTQTSNRILPVGITINGADEHYISVRNNERSSTVAVWDNASRQIVVGLGNTWDGTVTTSGTVFVKLVYYK